ncbi:MAG: methyltransferase domain-containing protein [Pseudomonadota bacterium]
MTDESKTRQNWSAAGYGENARFVSDYGEVLFSLLDDKPNQRILDLGCGDGALAEKLVALGHNVTAVDQSPDFVEAAQAKGLNAFQMDGHALAFDQPFDCVFSNAALHWMLEPNRVIEGVSRSLVESGVFVGEMGGQNNVAAIVTALLASLEMEAGLDGRPLHPWYFPSPDGYAALLDAHGFKVEAIELIPRPTPLPTGISGWLETFANPFVADLDATARQAVLARAEALLEPSLMDENGNWTADYVRLRFKARKDH